MGRKLKGNSSNSPSTGGNAGHCQVAEPGTDQPLQDVDQLMAEKVSHHADGIIQSLIDQAKEGHYQAAQYLLSEFHRIRAELKDLSDDHMDQHVMELVDWLEQEREAAKAKKLQ